MHTHAFTVSHAHLWDRFRYTLLKATPVLLWLVSGDHIFDQMTSDSESGASSEIDMDEVCQKSFMIHGVKIDYSRSETSKSFRYFYTFIETQIEQ